MSQVSAIKQQLVLKNLNINDITPKYFETRRFNLTNATRKSPVAVICLYVARPIILRLKALYEAISSFLLMNAIDPNSKVSVGVRHYRPILSIDKRKMRVFSLRNKPYWIDCDCLTYRRSELFTIVAFSRNVILYLHNKCEIRDEIEHSPIKFVQELLNKVDYPKYVLKYAIMTNKVNNLLETLEKIRYNNIRGWRITL